MRSATRRRRRGEVGLLRNSRKRRFGSEQVCSSLSPGLPSFLCSPSVFPATSTAPLPSSALPSPPLAHTWRGRLLPPSAASSAEYRTRRRRHGRGRAPCPSLQGRGVFSSWWILRGSDKQLTNDGSQAMSDGEYERLGELLTDRVLDLLVQTHQLHQAGSRGAKRTLASVSKSTLAVASSMRMTVLLRSNALANASNCLCPAE